MSISNQVGIQLGKGIVFALGVAGLPLAAVAQDNGLRYGFIELDYINQDVDQAGEGFEDVIRGDFDDGGGWGIRGSLPLGENFFVFGNYSDTESDLSFTDDVGVVYPADTDVIRLDLGVGWRMPVTAMSDLLLSAAYTDIDYEDFNIGAGSTVRPSDLDDDPSDGYFLDVSWRAQLTNSVEASIGGRYTDIEDIDNFSIVGNLMYEITQEIGVNLSLDAGDDLMTWGLGMRYSF